MKLHRPWISLFIIVACITVTLGFHHHIASYYVKHAIDAELEFLIGKLETHVTEAIRLNDEFMGELAFDCSTSDVEKMQRVAFTSPHVRLFEVHTDNNKECSSHGMAVEQDEKESWKNLHDNIFIGSELNKITHTHDLTIIHQGAGFNLIADIEPIHIPKAFCENCAVLKVQLGSFDILVSDLNHVAEDLSFSSFIQSEVYPFSLSLAVSKNYLSPVEHWSGGISLAIGFFLGVMLVLGMQWLLSQNQTLEALIKQGLERHEFKPFYQPIVHSKSGKIVGCEVLARWVKKDGTVIPPYQFIPFAEDSGLILPITEQLLYRVVRDIKTLNWGETDKFMSVNIVPEHLQNDDLFHTLESLKDDSWQYHNISLEITERRKIEDLALAKKTLEKFYELGIELKLDDAGTGYGGFSYVQELKISTIKIDKMFIDVIGTDDMKTSVLSSIIAFANEAYAMKTIAEGVETPEQVDLLAKHGVYKIQGYVYAKPMPIKELIEWKKIAKPLISMASH